MKWCIAIVHLLVLKFNMCWQRDTNLEADQKQFHVKKFVGTTDYKIKVYFLISHSLLELSMDLPFYSSHLSVCLFFILNLMPHPLIYRIKNHNWILLPLSVLSNSAHPNKAMAGLICSLCDSVVGRNVRGRWSAVYISLMNCQSWKLGSPVRRDLKTAN